MAILDAEALAERARNLGTLNGARLVLVSLAPAAAPVRAVLEVRFHSANHVAAILLATAGNPAQARAHFPIRGGRRLRAGSASGEVQVTDVAAGPSADSLLLTVEPIGDYSTYTLAVRHPGFDALPAFREVPFKFRPACFSAECAPCVTPGAPRGADPPIDYLAKDYDSFRHTLIAAMMRRVPGWTPSSEADLDQVLIELVSVGADELSDYQDRVMNEAYLGTARKRVSVARHARLVDYHVHQGNQSATWLALEVSPGQAGVLPAGLVAWAGGPDRGDASAQVFVTREARHMHHLLNRMQLHTWSGAMPALEAGAVCADLALADPSQAAADAVTALICQGHVPELLIEEALDPATGRPAGRDLRKRQPLRLRPCGAGVEDPGAESVFDALQARWIVRVRWRDEDRLRFRYCGSIDCPPPLGRVDGVSLFRGNLVRAFHGAPRTVRFLPPGTPPALPGDLYYERDARDAPTAPAATGKCCEAHGTPTFPGRGATCRLPEAGLMYRDTPLGGEVPPRSTLDVEAHGVRWYEQADFIHSDAEADDFHFVVETDEHGRSTIRFGHDGMGRDLPEGAIVTCRYQHGDPLAGNVGADSIVHCDRGNVAFGPLLPVDLLRFQALMAAAVVYQPFDVTDGRVPEPMGQVLRRAPEAYAVRQLRAVTLEDYVRRAEEVEGVSRAAASYAWTGSWRTVRVTIDPLGAAELAPALAARVARYLEGVRLIGEDLEIRGPRFVPLDVRLVVCASPDAFASEVDFALRAEFSDAYTADGRQGFFHPDRFTFGQELHASEILGRALAVPGVEHVVSLAIKRWGEAGDGGDAIAGLRHNEVLLVAGDPDDAERGYMDIRVRGGRQ